MIYNINGWIKQNRDIRDFSIKNDEVKNFYKDILLPSKYDLSANFDVIDNQGNFGTCTANALRGIVGYLYKINKRPSFQLSRAFNYFYGRKIIGLNTKEDTGTTIRAIVKSLATYGTVPETKFTYIKSHILTNVAPSIAIRKLALSRQAIKYVLLDQPSLSGLQKVMAFKQALVNKLPIIVGFVVFDNYDLSNTNGGIFLYPEPTNVDIGGHAVVIVGYDDNKVCGKYTGAFKIRNSWGTDWGEKGYGWIPYEYLIQNLMMDGWNIISTEMI